MAPRPNLPDLSPAYDVAKREARRLCRSINLPRHEQEDIQQDLLADFLTRLPAYDPTKAELAAFAMVCMRHAGTGELQQPWREVAASDSTVQAVHLLAPEMLRDTALAHATDAASEAARLLDLHKQRRDYVQAEVWLTQAHAAIDLGAIVRLVTPRLGYGYGAGRSFVVVGITVNARRTRLSLDLWG